MELNTIITPLGLCCVGGRIDDETKSVSVVLEKEKEAILSSATQRNNTMSCFPCMSTAHDYVIVSRIR